MEGLVKSRTWKNFCLEEVPRDANILNDRFVLAIKAERTRKEIWNARFSVQGHRDSMKQSLVYSTSVSRQQSTKITVVIAAIFGFQLYSSDVTKL